MFYVSAVTNLTVSEDISLDSQVMRTSASDGDLDVITYSIIAGNDVSD